VLTARPLALVPVVRVGLVLLGHVGGMVSASASARRAVALPLIPVAPIHTSASVSSGR
jgi:hypothetical protein